MSVGTERQDVAPDRDNELANEIASAMRQSLEQQAVMITRLLALMLFFAIVILAEYLPVDARGAVKLAAWALTMAALFFARYMKAEAIRGEVKYRRQNGKWRWDH